MSINVSVQMSVVGERQVHASIHDPFASLSVECGTNSVAIVYRSVEEIAKHATALFQLAKDFGAALEVRPQPKREPARDEADVPITV